MHSTRSNQFSKVQKQYPHFVKEIVDATEVIFLNMDLVEKYPMSTIESLTDNLICRHK